MVRNRWRSWRRGLDLVEDRLKRQGWRGNWLTAGHGRRWRTGGGGGKERERDGDWVFILFLEEESFVDFFERIHVLSFDTKMMGNQHNWESLSKVSYLSTLVTKIFKAILIHQKLRNSILVLALNRPTSMEKSHYNWYETKINYQK